MSIYKDFYEEYHDKIIKMEQDIEAYQMSEQEATEIIAELKHENKRLQEENEKLKKRQITKNGFICDCEQNAKYKQALEEIREMLKKSMSLKSNAYNHFINVEKAIDKINEVLNDRN